MIFDLHTHSTCSDGSLSPAELIDVAANHGVECLAITDHDSISAYNQPEVKQQTKLQLVNGIEFSTSWNGIGVHIVGLDFDLDTEAIQTGTKFQQNARVERAEKIAERLEKAGLLNALEGARKFSASGYIARPHFAQYMVESGFCKNFEQAFKKHLGAGKPCDYKQQWASMAQVISWIKDSNGIAILAHPYKYKMTRSKLLRLIDDFIEAGGKGIEILSGKQDKTITENLSAIAQQKNLLASLGSDFHSPNQHWARPGMHTQLPSQCTPVWERFR